MTKAGRRALLLLLLSVLTSGRAQADWVVYKDGQVIEVHAVSFTERTAEIVTLTNRRWYVAIDLIDIARTERANHPEGPRKSSLPLLANRTGVEPAVRQAPPDPLEPEPRTPEAAPEARVSEPQPDPKPTTPTPPPPRPPLPSPPTTLPQTTMPSSEPTSADTHPRSGARRPRLSFFVNGAIDTRDVAFTESRAFELFREEARIDSDYRNERARGYEVGIFYRIGGPAGVGASVELFRADRDASFSASLPHPFFFERFRDLSGSRSNLLNEETAVHLDGVLMHTWGPLSLDVFAGPTWFRTRSEVIVDVLYDEVFPFDEVIPAGVEGRVFEHTPLGFNVGASATVRVGGVLGVDFALRYSRAIFELELDDNREIALESGGLRLGAGLRFLFP